MRLMGGGGGSELLTSEASTEAIRDVYSAGLRSAHGTCRDMTLRRMQDIESGHWNTTHGGEVSARTALLPVCRKRPFTTHADRLTPASQSREACSPNQSHRGGGWLARCCLIVEARYTPLHLF